MPFHTLHLSFRFILNVQSSIGFSLHFIFFTLGFAFFILDLNTNEFPIVSISGCLVEVRFETFHFFKRFLAPLGFDDHAAISPKFESFHEIVLGL